MQNYCRSMIFLVAIPLLLSGCSDLRKLTYPRDFTYIDKTDLHNGMFALSASLAKLDALVSANGPVGKDKQKAVIDELNRLDRIANRIRGKGEHTNHLVIDEHMDQFLGDIDNAKLFAENRPPNYYYAGKLAGSCTACHEYR